MAESLIVTLGLKDAGVNKQITAINKELRFLDKEFKTANKSSKDFETSSEGLKNKLAYLEKKYEANSEKLKAYKQKVEDTKTAIAKKEEELQKLTSADALGYMSLAGWDTQQMLAGLEPILRMSEAAGADLALTSNLVTDSMSSLGVEVNDLNRYLDIVAKSQSSANTSATQMLEGYISCGGTFKNLNVPLEESATWISVLANRGKKASEAGNSLNSVLVNLTGGSSTAKGAMDELGVSAWDLDGNFIGIEATLRLLNDALATCTQDQKTNFESAIGGKTQLDTLQALLSGLNEEYVDLKATITDSDGELNKLAQTMQDNAKGNVTKLKFQLEGLGIQIGNYLLPHINSLLEHLSNLITWFDNLDESTQKSIVQFGLMTFAGGGLLKGIGSLTQKK